MSSELKNRFAQGGRPSRGLDRTFAFSQIPRSPARILAIVLGLIFTVEIAVMVVLPQLVPVHLGDGGTALLDAMLLTVICAPVLWWVIIGPLRRIAIQEQQRSQTIVANASEGILTCDRNQTIVSCNSACSKLFGIKAQKSIGQSIRRFIPDLPVTFDSFPCERRFDGVNSANARFPMHVSISEYQAGSQQRLIVIVRDLTDTEKAEQERITSARETEALRAQQMTTLAQLATGVAHEVRNPLTSIKMLIQVNRAKFAEMGLPTDDLELVEHEIRRMERSVVSLLDYARPEESEFRDFPIQDAVRRTMDLIDGQCAAQRVELDADLPDDPLVVTGDVAQLQQLMLNLSLNAVDAMPNGGQLHVKVCREGDQVRVVVGDTGDGVCESVVDKLFSPFVTTKANGVGLGLGICRRIADIHRGTLTGTNRSEGGAEFTLTMPLAMGANELGSGHLPKD